MQANIAKHLNHYQCLFLTLHTLRLGDGKRDAGQLLQLSRPLRPRR